MSSRRAADRFGEPDLRVGPLRIWIHGWEFDDADDFDDGNWLRVTADVGPSEPRTLISGAILRTDEIERFARGLRAVEAARSGEANLATLEAMIDVVLRDDGSDTVVIEIELRSEPMSDAPVHRATLDRAEVSRIAAQCESILERFPVRGRDQG